MSGSKSIKILLENITPHPYYFKVYLDGKLVKKDRSILVGDELAIELREYNIMLDKLWWVWNLILFIPSFFGGCFIWNDLNLSQRIISLTLTNISDIVDIKIQNDMHNLIVNGATICKIDSIEQENKLIAKRARFCKQLLIIFAVSVLIVIVLALALTFLLM